MIINILCAIIPSLCLSIGFYFGFKVGKSNDLPKSIPEQIKEIKEKKIEEKEKNIMNDYLSNIDNYPYNQVDIKE